MTDHPPAPSYRGPRRIFSGMQPTGGLHLGNYLGALVKFVRLQHEAQALYCVVDLHALTADHDPKSLRARVREVAAAYVAAGVDPGRSIVFVQSAVREHAELAWIFTCVARMGWLERMTQFKDKAGKDAERSSVGLFSYPVLQAADILLYKATHVPIGEDQRQHLELARDIAAKFNNDFGAQGFFPLPESLADGPGARVMSLRDGARKMSKSDPSDAARLNLTDDADTILQKLRRATSDSLPVPASPEELEGRPEAKNLIGIYAALAEQTEAEALAAFAGKGWGYFKPALAELAAAKLAPVAAEMRRLLSDARALDAILEEGAARARAIAQPVMAEVRAIVGLPP